ncbi:MAG: AAA family ATPase [Nakamurella sp.]
MLSTEDLDDILVGDQEITGPVAVAASTRRALIPGSPVARALYLVWSGTPVTVVDSPPGAGKSTLITEVIAHLMADSDLVIAVATPTRRQSVDLALRIAAEAGAEFVSLGIKNISEKDCPEGMTESARKLAAPGQIRRVTVKTLASMKFGRVSADLLIIDESYQATAFDVYAAASDCRQILMVGDPGQIGPVVTVNTSAWESSETAPHRRAAEVFRGREDAQTVHLPNTYRFGPDTVDAILPLYDFTFGSARAAREVVGRNELASVEVDSDGDPRHLPMLHQVAEQAAGLIGRTVRAADEYDRTLTATDVAVVLSHNVQANIVRGMLNNMGIEGMTVDTADKLQGGQWEAVVALDPLVGAGAAEGHSASLGRLCVMASRHRSHLTWVHDGTWSDLLESDTELDPDERDRAILTRERLTR